MAINFDKLPTAKPSQNATITEGRHLVKITKADMVERAADTPYLRITFVTKEKESFTENFFEGTKPFLMYKLGRLLNATGVVLEGEGSLSDVGKLVVGKKAIVDVTINDKGYAGLDFSDKKEGIYKTDEVVIEDAVTVDDDDEF